MTIYDKINNCTIFGTNKLNKSILFDLVKSIEDNAKLQRLDLHKLDDYFYKTTFMLLDYDYANEYYRNHSVQLGACSSLTVNGIHGRNYDWKYDNQASFLVCTHKSESVLLPGLDKRHAVIGMSGNIPELTNEFVQSGKWNDIYKLIPFKLLDGINDAGLQCSSYVVPADNGITTGTTPLLEEKMSICSIMLPRFILDNFSNILDATTYINNYISVYSPIVDEKPLELHVSVSQKIGNTTFTFICELINNRFVVTELDPSDAVTNFFINDAIKVNGKYVLPTAADVNPSGLTKYAMGVERCNALLDAASTVNSITTMRTAMNSVKYSNAYHPNQSLSDFWATEFIGDYDTIDLPIWTNKSEVYNVVKPLIQDWPNRKRDGKYWLTVWSSIYDLTNKEVYIITQESNNERRFNINGLEKSI